LTYAKAFFDLQLEFAGRISAVSGMALARALLGYTNFYIRFGLGRDFDPGQPSWQEYLAGLREAKDAGGWTYRFYLSRTDTVAPPGLVATFGCFSYGRLSGNRLRLHFQNAEPDGRSALAKDRQGQRLAELAALFDHVKRSEREPRSVVGASWLYNLDAYRCLFPRSYLATAHVIRGRFRHLPLWGQFVDRFGKVKAVTALRFLERLARQSSLENLDDCFPFQVLALEAPVGAFFEHHGL
jgi:hypothetical protein